MLEPYINLFETRATMKRFRLPMIILLLLMAGWGCDPYAEEEYREYFVIESYLIAEEPLPEILLSRTLPLSERYSFQEAAVAGAEITLFQLDEQGDRTEPGIPYEMQSTTPGIYWPTSSTERVEPRRTYQLEISLPELDDPILAETTVPDTFHVSGEVPEAVEYQTDTLEVAISPNSLPGRQNVYLFNTIAADPTPANLTPFYRDLIETEDEDIRLYENNPSDLINEGNFDIEADGSIRIRLPWLGIAFYGLNQIVINSVDRNLSDFLRSQGVQLGGSTLAPGEIPNAIYHIEGAIGIFGSVAADTISTRITRPVIDEW